MSADFSGVRGVMFDLDNTLIVRKYALEKVAGYISRLWFADEPERWGELRDCFCRSFVSGYDRYPDCWREFCEEIKWRQPKPFNKFMRLWNFFYPYSTVREPSVEAVKTLRERGYRLGILTNGDEIQQNAKIDVVGFRDWFDVITVSDTIGCEKPDVRAFRHCADKMGLPFENLVYVGDYWRNDIVGAREAGMKTVWMSAYMDWETGVAPADAEIGSLWELLPLLP